MWVFLATASALNEGHTQCLSCVGAIWHERMSPPVFGHETSSAESVCIFDVCT